MTFIVNTYSCAEITQKATTIGQTAVITESNVCIRLRRRGRWLEGFVLTKVKDESRDEDGRHSVIRYVNDHATTTEGNQYKETYVSVTVGTSLST